MLGGLLAGGFAPVDSLDSVRERLAIAQVSQDGERLGIEPLEVDGVVGTVDCHKDLLGFGQRSFGSARRGGRSVTALLTMSITRCWRRIRNNIWSTG